MTRMCRVTCFIHRYGTMLRQTMNFLVQNPRLQLVSSRSKQYLTFFRPFITSVLSFQNASLTLSLSRFLNRSPSQVMPMPLGIKVRSEEGWHRYKGSSEPSIQWRHLRLSHHIRRCLRLQPKRASGSGCGKPRRVFNCKQWIYTQCIWESRMGMHRTLCENRSPDQKLPCVCSKLLSSPVSSPTRWQVVRWRGPKKQCQVSTRERKCNIFSRFRKESFWLIFQK